MKGCHFFLILVVATFGANADSLNSQLNITYPNVAVPLSGEFTLKWPATSALSTPNDLYGPAMTPGLVAGFRHDMAYDVKATRAFIHKGAAKASKYDALLLLLAAIGVVVLQLRRTHKSLPQRTIIAY